MKIRTVVWFIYGCFVLSSTSVAAGVFDCYGKTSTTSHFECDISPWNSGNCTWWAASRRSDLAAVISVNEGGGWNGGQWYDRFKDFGFPVGLKPKAGSVVEFSNPGHVAYVEGVHSDGSFDVSEMDAYHSPGFVIGINHATYHPDGNGTYHRNSGSPGAWILKGFIYPKGVSSETDTICDYVAEQCDIRIQGDVGWFPPVSLCQGASEWFIIDTDANGKKYPVASRPDASACPTACSPN